MMSAIGAKINPATVNKVLLSFKEVLGAVKKPAKANMVPIFATSTG